MSKTILGVQEDLVAALQAEVRKSLGGAADQTRNLAVALGIAVDKLQALGVEDRLGKRP